MPENRTEKAWAIYLIAAVSAIGGILFGFHTTVIAGALLQLTQLWSMDALAEAVLVTDILVGGLIGSVFAGRLADTVGRRYLVMGTAVIFVVGSFWAGIAPNQTWLMAGRFILGLGLGAIAVAVPLFIAEISPAHVRGVLVSLNHLATVLGVLLAYLVNAIYAAKVDGWRSMFMAGAVPGVMLALGMVFLPESPRWLVSIGRPHSARRMLRRMGVANIEAGVQALQDSLKENEKSLGTLRDLLTPELRHPLLVGFGLMFFQLLSGIDAVIFFAPKIFQSVGFSSATQSTQLSVGIGIVNLVATLFSLLIVDRFGRRPLFLWGSAFMAASVFLMGALLGTDGQLVGFAKWLTVGCICLYIAAFALGLGAVASLVASEIYPQKVRGAAMGLVMLSNWLFQIIAGFTFLPMAQAFGIGPTFAVYGFIIIGGVAFGLFYMPETKGKTLEEIEAHWEKGLPPWKLR